MQRIYGDEQRAAVKQIQEELIRQIDELYLKTFEQLNDFGLGDGVIVRLTQLLLLSKDAAITPLKEGIEKKHI